MEERKFSPEQSLALIQSMIDKAKNTAADDSFYFLLWGLTPQVPCNMF
jgi:hypothetical protein